MKYLKLLRINQWLKNLVIFIPIFFSGSMFIEKFYLKGIFAFLAFSLVSSSMYLVNDIVDFEKDKLHPYKKERVELIKELTPTWTLILSVIVLAGGILVERLFVQSEYFLLILACYVLIMLMYSFFLKNIGIVDVITIAIGFVLRAVSGAVIFQLEISAFLLLSIIGMALLISFGKRKLEVIQLGEKAIKHRTASEVYPNNLLDYIISSTMAITFTAYILFAYSFQSEGLNFVLNQYLPPMFRYPHWLLLTTPIALYVLIRYLSVIYKGKVHNVESIWFKDKELLIGILIWVVVLFVLIYSQQIATISL
ncbi:MAG TPA: UbiA family prenyltransferase [Candidatus Dojkabacteria bacterium]|nr:UbiA family prenyltransferase [Candidatus Dojkabacteria bacterium]